MDDVYKTGTINSNLSIGAVGGVHQKAIAVAEIGAQAFLVPEGQDFVYIYKPVKVMIGRRSFIRYEKNSISLERYLEEKGYNPKIVYIEKIEDTFDIFTNARALYSY